MPRELVGLQFIASAQPVLTEHYRDFLGLSPRVAHRSLAKLRDNRLVTVHAPVLERPNAYTLGPAAPALLSRVFDAPVESFWVPRSIRRPHHEHHHMSVDVHVKLAVATAHSKHHDLQAFEHEHVLRSRGKSAPGSVVPDALAYVGDASLAVESDTGRENPRWVADHKGVPYRDLADLELPVLGAKNWRVAVITTTERRMKALVKALWREARIQEGLFYFALARELDSGNILTKNPWRTPRVHGSRVRLVAECPVHTSRTNGLNGHECQLQRSEADHTADPRSPFTSWEGV